LLALSFAFPVAKRTQIEKKRGHALDYNPLDRASAASSQRQDYDPLGL
jgi:hypothetical protein